MQQDVDVASADAERLRDVLTRSLLEQPQHHDGLLRLAQLIDARAQADVLLGLGDELLGRARVRRHRQRVEVLVRARHMMTAALVARGVADDAGEVRGPLGGVGRGLFLLRELQKRAECILYGLDGVLGPGALPPGRPDELRPAAPGKIAQDSEHIRALGETGSGFGGG